MSAPTFSIRSIREADWAEVDRVQRSAFMAEAVEDIGTIKRLWELAPETCLVAESDQLLGYLIAHPWLADDLPPLNVNLPSLPPNAKTLFIHDLALRPEARGNGVAQSMVTSIFARARTLGLTDASLLSIQGSHGFWSKRGFQPRPDLAEKVEPILSRFLKTEFVFMSRANLN